LGETPWLNGLFNILDGKSDIAVVKKTFRYSNVFLLQPLIPAFRISELIFEKRYKSYRHFHLNTLGQELYWCVNGAAAGPVKRA